MKIKCLLILLTVAGQLLGQRYEMIPYGDFETWTVRHVKESAILGGNSKTLYVVGPDSVINNNTPYLYKETPWTNSNAMAVVVGITKASNTTYRAERSPGNGCALLRSEYDSVKVFGLVNIKVMISGTLFLGSTLEPIRSVSDPYSKINVGIPFTKRPKALVLDYKANLSTSGIITKSTGFSSGEWKGKDDMLIFVYLQNRKELPNGKIVAKRIGTAREYISKSTPDWIDNHRLEIHYGNITHTPYYKEHMKLTSAYNGVNSKGEPTPVMEEGWGDENTPVTHIMVWISTGSMEPFVGTLGNEIMVDNVRLEY